MARIIAGRFVALPKADAAIQALRRAGFASDSVSTYHNNALGQHGLLATGGDEDATLPPQRRPACVMVAVRVEGGSASEDTAVAVLREKGAVAVEQAEGVWRDGQWADFDPLATPQLIWRSPDTDRLH